MQMMQFCSAITQDRSVSQVSSVIVRCGNYHHIPKQKCVCGFQILALLLFFSRDRSFTYFCEKQMYAILLDFPIVLIKLCKIHVYILQNDCLL